MTCRHTKGDPNCGSYQSHIDSARALLAKTSPTPDSANFEIEDVVEIGKHLVLKVRYPNCEKCAYEGNKVMVFLNTKPLDAMKWKEIDPHFRAPKVIFLNGPAPKVKAVAPSPAARFPASPEGWEDAKAYARSKAKP